MDNDICLWVIPEDGGKPTRLYPVHVGDFDIDDVYGGPIVDNVSHISLFDDVTFEFEIRLKRNIEELPPRYFKKNKEKNLTCVWMDRKRAVGMLRDLDRWTEVLKVLGKQRRAK